MDSRDLNDPVKLLKFVARLYRQVIRSFGTADLGLRRQLFDQHVGYAVRAGWMPEEVEHVLDCYVRDHP